MVNRKIRPANASPKPLGCIVALRRSGRAGREELIGQSVESLTGETIGKVNDLVINQQTGRVVFVVLASGGFLGVGVHLRPVPPCAVAPATAKRGIVMLDITPKRWKSAPRMNKERLQELENPAIAQTIYAYYNQSLLLPTARMSQDKIHSQNASLKLASELIGQSIINRRKGEVGRVADLAVNLKDFAPARAVISPVGTQRGETYSVPISALEDDAAGSRLYLGDDADSSLTTHSEVPIPQRGAFTAFKLAQL